MRDTVWQGKSQCRVLNTGIPNYKEVLTERGKYRKEMLLDEMHADLASHTDLKKKKQKLNIFSMIWWLIWSQCIFCPHFIE